MANIEFNIVITDEACTYARVAQANTGWYLKPKKWEISASSGELTSTRTTDSMFSPWVQQPFSGITEIGTNRLMHSVVIPPDAYATSMTIGELYFIYEDYYGNDFLYAIGQPTSSLVFTPGVSQRYNFVFGLNNVVIADTYIIDYTYPQDIADHNTNTDAHDYLLARDGSRTATSVLQYDSTKTFSNDTDIVDKKYVDDFINTSNNLNCPVGSMMWWPSPTAPDGWLVRDGSSLSISLHPKLYAVLGVTYGGGTDTFNLPNDAGYFIRGYKSGTTASFGQTQTSATTFTIPNTGYSHTNGIQASGNAGAIIIKSGNAENSEYLESLGYMTQSRTRTEKGSNKTYPDNRCYLPIIRDDY